MDKQENAWVQLSLHEQDLCLVKTSFILSYLHKRTKWTSMQNKPECQYKNQTLQRVFVLCECTWGLGLLQKESTYCTILFPFLLLGFGLLRWETKLALVFEIQTFHSFFFLPYWVSQTLLHLQTFETLSCSFSLVWGLSHTINFLKTELTAWWQSNSISQTSRELLCFHQRKCTLSDSENTKLKN